MAAAHGAPVVIVNSSFLRHSGAGRNPGERHTRVVGRSAFRYAGAPSLRGEETWTPARAGVTMKGAVGVLYNSQRLKAARAHSDQDQAHVRSLNATALSREK
jgi:hypothetical protein